MRLESSLTTFLLVLLATGCTTLVGRIHCDGETLSRRQTPVFGSSFAGGSFLDTAHSKLIPTHVLSTPGSLTGHWLAPDKVSELIVEPYDRKRDAVLSGDAASFAEDFRMRIVDQENSAFQIYFSAPYSAFQIFAADVDGDRLDEVVMEYGEGKGTFAYVRKLMIGKPGRRHLLTLFETDLNNYIGGEPQDGRKLPDPDMWIRRYAFTRAGSKGALDVQLCLVPPEHTPLYVGLTEWTGVLQFPELVYRINPQLHTYELHSFEFRTLK